MNKEEFKQIKKDRDNIVKEQKTINKDERIRNERGTIPAPERK